MNIDGNALVLGGDTNFAHPVAYALLASTTAAGIYNTIAGNYGLYITDAAFTYVGGGNASASLVFNWSTVTSPLIQSGTSGTQLTIGTNKSGAVLVLEADAAEPVVEFDWANNITTSFLSNIEWIAGAGPTT